jgi:hypothetical protein
MRAYHGNIREHELGNEEIDNEQRKSVDFALEVSLRYCRALREVVGENSNQLT